MVRREHAAKRGSDQRRGAEGQQTAFLKGAGGLARMTVTGCRCWVGGAARGFVTRRGGGQRRIGRPPKEGNHKSPPRHRWRNGDHHAT